MRLTAMSMLLVCIYDFSTRLLFTSENNQSLDVAFEYIPLSFTQANRLEVLNKAYAQFDEKIESEALTNNSTSQQSSGSYTKIFTQSQQLELKAVLNHEGLFALIEQKDLSNNQSQLVKVKNGDKIVGFTLTVQSQTQVALKNQDKAFVLMMYQPKSKEKV